MEDNTIAAISTPLGPGGIGIIRISGKDACKILNRIFTPCGQSPPDRPDATKALRSHRVYYGHIRDCAAGTIIDEVLVFFMKGPKSFTREDVVEIHSHSGYVVLDRLLNAVLDAGADLAGPGAFTKRAFLNGRIDLSQAEAVIDLINAPCETAMQMASAQVAGGLKNAVARILSTLYDIRARAEAAVDFPDDIPNGKEVDAVQRDLLNSVHDDVSMLVNKQKDAAIYRDGIVLAIAGVPNVGKSSLLNRLVEKEIAIVSEIPGTTRDVVREYSSIRGVPVVICDTAGIHPTVDPVESIGIQKAKEQINCADVVLLVTEATRPLNGFEDTLIRETDPRKIVVVLNKSDIGDAATVRRTVETLQGVRHVCLSAKTGHRVDELKRVVFSDLVSGRPVDTGQSVAPNLRHRKLLEEARDMLECGLMNDGSFSEGVAELLNRVVDKLEDISGKRGREALYDDIFNQFCIGK